MDPKLVEYIQKEISDGYSLNSIKLSLLKQGYPANTVDENINYVMQEESALINYIKQQRARKIEDDVIKAALINSGYPVPDINNALNALKKTPKLIYILAALIIFGLGLYMFWPSSEPASTKPSPGITEKEFGKEIIAEEIPEEPIPEEKGFEDFEKGLFEEENITNETAEEIVFEENKTAISEEGREEIPPEPEVTQFEEKTELEEIIEDVETSNVDTATQICTETDDNVYRDACFNQLAKSSSNPDYCENIINTEKKDSCYLSFILNSKDYSLCAKLVSEDLRQSCESLKETAS